MRGNMNKKRVTEIFYVKDEYVSFSNVVSDRIDFFRAKYIDGKVSRWPGEMRLYFSDNLWGYAWKCRHCNPHDVFRFGDHIFYHSVHRDSALGTNKMRIEYTWEEEMGPEEIKEATMHLYWAPMTPKLRIKKVIFHNPAVIVYWHDNTKTVVKVQEGDTWDPEKGLAMAIVKKSMGLKSFYNHISSQEV